MSNRSDLCDTRELLERIDREVASIEVRVSSANAAHELGRARSMITAASEFITRALGQQVDGTVDAVRS